MRERGDVKFEILEIKGFLDDVRRVDLKNLMSEAERLDALFGEISRHYDEAYAVWTAKAPQSGYKSLTKTQLLKEARDASATVRASMDKEQILAELFRTRWENEEVYKTYKLAEREHAKLLRWRDDVLDFPEKLRQIIQETSDLAERLQRKSQGSIHALADQVQWMGLDVLTASTLAKMASSSLREIEKGASIEAEIVRLVESCNQEIRFLLPNNLHATGHGLKQAADQQAAKAMMQGLKNLVPPQARKYLWT